MKRKVLASLGIATALVLGAIGIASASVPDSSGQIHSCYSAGLLGLTPSFRVIDSASQSCNAGETALNWAQNGGSYAKFAGSDSIVTNSSGVVTHAPAAFTVSCNTGDLSDQGILTMNGSGASSIWGTGINILYEGTHTTVSSMIDDVSANTGITNGLGIGLPNANITLKYYTVCLPVPTLPS